jgi:murein DD-endopeptidase MepM/ murein hydrolase activator NlpD
VSGRALAYLALAVAGVVMACAGLAGALVGGGAAAACPAAPGAVPRSSPPTAAASRVDGAVVGSVGRWSGEQVANAATILAVGAGEGVPARGWVIAVATAMQESALRNLPGGDRDSVGLFQQRPSMGWGTPSQLRDPAYAAGAFYARLVTLEGWQAMPLAAAAQSVQRSAYPRAYARWEPDATALVAALTGLDARGAGCVAAAVSGRGWTRPLPGRIVSGFRPPGRPNHDGVDLAAPKGTPVHAAAAGVVSRVRCNAVLAATGAAYGCDHDGHPTRVRGCGWYVDLTHPGGILTRYCHLARRPALTEGQAVTAGAVIGVTGSSGRSSGPHLHYEVHLGDPTRATATDPVPFMAAVGAPLT